MLRVLDHRGVCLTLGGWGSGSIGRLLNIESVGSALCMKCNDDDDNNNNGDNNEFSCAGRRAYLNLFIPFRSVLSIK